MEQSPEDFLFSVLQKYGEIPEEEKINLRKDPELQKGFNTRTLKKGDYFLRQGDFPEQMALISSGLFRVFCLSESGEEKTLAFRQREQFLSAYSPFLTNQETWYSIQALTNSEIVFFPLESYTRLLSKHPCWEGVVKNYIIKLFIEKEDRERSFLLEDATTRYLNFKRAFPYIETEISQYYIASYLGISPVSLSRIRTKLKKENGV